MLGDTMRGTRGLMLDKFRQPEKILDAWSGSCPCRRLGRARLTGHPAPDLLHPAAQGRRRLHCLTRTFSTFYWPTLKKVVTWASSNRVSCR